MFEGVLNTLSHGLLSGCSLHTSRLSILLDSRVVESSSLMPDCALSGEVSDNFEIDLYTPYSTHTYSRGVVAS